MDDAALVPSDSSCCAPCAEAEAASPEILARYHRYFRTQRADTPELIRSAQAIRYQVYCLERKFENPSEHAGCTESDAFDATAVHCLVLHRPTSEAIGTTRLILPGSRKMSPDRLPILHLLRENGISVADHFPVESSAEVSRFAISNAFRRRCSETLADGDVRREKEVCGVLPCLGLIQELVRQSRVLGLSHWAAVMEPKLLRMLAAMGIHFTPVGPAVSYHGLRQPSHCHLPEMLDRLHHERPDHWAVVTDGGALSTNAAHPSPALAHQHAA